MSQINLEQILEMLLNEDTQSATEALHEYVVAKARAEYERVLDESEEIEEMDHSDESDDFREDVIAGEEMAEEELEGDMYEDDDLEMDDMDGADEVEMSFDDEGDMDMDMDMGAEETQGDVADKVDDLEDELEELRAEFEKLMAAEMDEPEHSDMDFGDEEDDEEAEENEEELEEATNFSSKESRQPLDGKQVEADSTESPYSKAPKQTKVSGAGEPVRIKDGGDGDSGDNKAKDHTPEDNLDVPSKSHGSSYGSGAKKPEAGDKDSPLTKAPGK